MRIRPNELRTPRSITRVASDVGQRLKKSAGGQIRDRFDKATDTLRSRLARAKGALKPAFKDMFEGIRRRDHSRVLRGAHDLAGRLNVVFAPPRNANTGQVLTTLGQTVVRPNFRYVGAASMRELYASSLDTFTRNVKVADKSYTNDPDTSLRKPRIG